MTDDKRIADFMNNYFVNISRNLGLKRSFIHVSQPLKSTTIHVFGNIQRTKLPNSFKKKKILNVSSKKSIAKGDITNKIPLKIELSLLLAI